MTELVGQYIQHFSYAGLLIVLVLCGLGLPVPEDLALLTGGFLAYRGVTGYPQTLVIAFIGVVAGDNSLFFLGRRFGTGLISYLTFRGPSAERRVRRLKDFMHRHGHLAIFYARFLAGARALVYVTAGSVGVEFSRFVFYDTLGALISVPVVVTAGYLFGPQLEYAAQYLGSLERVIFVIVISAILYLASRSALAPYHGEVE